MRARRNRRRKISLDHHGSGVLGPVSVPQRVIPPRRRGIAGEPLLPHPGIPKTVAAPRSPEKWAHTMAVWKAELRAFGTGHAPANYLKLSFDDVCTAGAAGRHAALRAHLAALGATTPSCVYARKLPGAQANLRHGRLSIGGKHLGRHITEALTDAELDTIIDDDLTGGLPVAVLDRDGRRYDLRCLYAEDTGFYRLAGPAEYARFMADNNVVRDVAELGKELFMEVWAFRSPALRKGEKQIDDDDHPDGALGMVILFFDLEADTLGDELFDDDSLTLKQILKHYPKAPQGYKLE
ncbi:hypothetical protein ACP4OV_031939 [Aristida adscensionis]